MEKATNDQLTAAKKPIAQVIRGAIEDTMANSVKPVLKAHRRKITSIVNRQSSINRVTPTKLSDIATNVG